jgi:hypothetical protein
MQKLRNVGFILLGAFAGVLVSLNFQAIAERRPSLPIEELRAFTEVFGAIKTNYVEPVEDKKLITEAINGMLTGLDPHSAYLDQEAFKELQVGTQGQFGGLGIEVGMEDGFVKVISPIEDTPAFRAGVKPGDLIVKLDDTPVKGMSLNDAVKRMRGKPNTQITLTISRKGESAPVIVTLTRAVIRVQSVKSKMIEPGYVWIRVSQFQEATAEHLVKHLDGLFKRGQVKGLVLDLRNDPGGLLHGAVAISSAFLPQKSLVVSTDGRAEDARKKFYASPEDYARRGDDECCAACRGGEERADGGAGERRLGLGVGNRRRRAAGPQARQGDRHADLRQGLGADHHAARQQHRDQADHGALLHAERPLDPGARHHARHHGRGSERHRHPRARSRPATPPREQRRAAEGAGLRAARQARGADSARGAEADRDGLEGRLPAHAGDRLPQGRAGEEPVADRRAERHAEATGKTFS